jgi:RNA polymerase sigma factor (sigma-70 family)
MATMQAIEEDTEAEHRERCDAIFEKRYDEIMSWALRLTHFDRAAAEELVHDAYIDLAQSATNIHQITNLDGYLYRVLRNVNYTRRRKAWKHEHDGLDLLNHQSSHPELRLRALAEQFESQDQLRMICAFLCWRKETSRTASLLLLRFFWGFEPQEIMGMTGLTRTAVDNQISAARREARSYLTSPETFQAGRKAVPTTGKIGAHFSADIDGLFTDLRGEICGTCSNRCPTRKRHPHTRDIAGQSALTISELAHLVSCRKCLNHVARKLSLTLPGDRWPLDDSPVNQNEIRRRLRYQRPRLLTAGSATELIRGAPATGDEKVSYWSLLFFPIMALLILLWAVVCLFQDIVQSETKEHASKIP